MTEEENNQVPVEGGKQRHGCLTAYLVFALLANAVSSLIYLFAGESLIRSLPEAPVWIVYPLAILGFANIACVIGLFTWKKWGFYGFIGTSIITFGLNLSSGLGIAGSLSGLIGIAILYGVLQIGEQNKGWPQLE